MLKKPPKQPPAAQGYRDIFDARDARQGPLILRDCTSVEWPKGWTPCYGTPTAARRNHATEGTQIMLARSLRATLFAMLCALVCALAAFSPPAAAATESVVYSFQNNGQDGYFPAAALTAVGTTLYGTTADGGTGSCTNGCGTIFSLDLETGTETVISSFQSESQQQAGPGSLLKEDSELFGTTTTGGNRDQGSLFSLNLNSGAFMTRYSFCNLYNCTDGANPAPGLLDWKGLLYGTTASGGGSGGGKKSNGVVFSFDPNTDTETRDYSFCHDRVHRVCVDGRQPAAGLIRVKHGFYGTAEFGGAGCPTDGGCGTIFSINPVKGTEKAIYSFCQQPNCADGARPVGLLLDMNEVLYGVTVLGGMGTCSGYVPGCGTVYSIDPATGVEKVLHAFAQDGADGLSPLSGLVESNGMLYGTTISGGAHGAGTVYSIDPSTGTETVVYSFCSQPHCGDGASPQAALVNVNGTLYGTTYYGGVGTCSKRGCGTVFAITP